MESPLKQKKNKILKRLDNTLKITVNTMKEINIILERMIHDNKPLRDTSDVFRIWRDKMN